MKYFRNLSCQKYFRNLFPHVPPPKKILKRFRKAFSRQNLSGFKSNSFERNSKVFNPRIEIERNACVLLIPLLFKKNVDFYGCHFHCFLNEQQRKHNDQFSWLGRCDRIVPSIAVHDERSRKYFRNISDERFRKYFIVFQDLKNRARIEVNVMPPI